VQPEGGAHLSITICPLSAWRGGGPPCAQGSSAGPPTRSHTPGRSAVMSDQNLQQQSPQQQDTQGDTEGRQWQAG
jgi:hypothetical protein